MFYAYAIAQWLGVAAGSWLELVGSQTGHGYWVRALACLAFPAFTFTSPPSEIGVVDFDFPLALS